MKTIGMLGGMSWESTATYYRLLNEGVKQALGGLHSARILLCSVDFEEIEVLQQAGDWDAAGRLLARAAARVEAGGADFLLLCTNTMHRVAPAIEGAVAMPLLHIADAMGEKLREDGIAHAGLLGTRFTMEQDFLKSRLTGQFGIRVTVPDAEGRAHVHRIIYEELCLGAIRDASRATLLEIIAGLDRAGAGAVILGCTELSLLAQQRHTRTSLYDSTAIHAAHAVARAIGR